jgi:hypothetical protein
VSPLRGYLVLGVTALACAIVAPSVGAGRSITAPPSTNADPTGDSGTAPDITQVSVTNDDHGQYTFTISFATPYGSTTGIVIFLDTDVNATTGDPETHGADYVLVDDRASQASELAFWGPSGWERAQSKTMSVTVGSDLKSVVLSLNKSDLNGVTSFNYIVVSYEGNADSGNFDVALSGTGSFQYTLQTVFTLLDGGTHADVPKAGGAWTIGMLAVRSDTGKSVGSEGVISCNAHAGSTPLLLRTKAFVTPASGQGAVASCTFAVPKRLKGAALSGTLTVRDGSQSVSEAFKTKAK